MKNLKLILCTIICFLFMGTVKASTINSVDTTVDIDNEGNGHITEMWTINANEGTENYHSFGNLNDRTITDYNVSMDGKEYTFVDTWDINATKAEKSYKNGINYTSDGLELCHGIEYGTHTYTIKYTIENLVWQYDDTQIMYFAFLPQNMNPAPKEFNLTIQSNQAFKNIKYSSYGFKSTNNIKNGKIYLKSSKALSSNDYVVALVGFPNDTFTNLNITKSGTYDDITDEALEGATLNKNINIWEILSTLFLPIIFLIVGISVLFSYLTNKPIVDKTNYNIPKKVNNFRDIPFNKDFILAYYIAKEEKLFSKKNLIGSYLLKWIKEKRILMVPTEAKKLDFNKNDNYYIDITSINDSPVPIEQSLIVMLKSSSKDGQKVTPKDFKKYCSIHYEAIEQWLKDAEEDSKNKLIQHQYIEESTKATKTNKSKKIFIYTKKLEEEVIKLKGLKQFLEDMSAIEEKKAIEVHLWDEYLIFAQAMGIADKVAKQFKDFYPQEYTQNNLYNDVMWVSYFSTTSVSAAQNAKSAASSGGSFSGGGSSSGGFSSGGGIR